MIGKPGRIKELLIETTQGHAGQLLRQSQFVLRYSDEALSKPERAISLTMPVTPAGYAANRIPPALAMQLPEGYLLNYLSERFAKTVDIRDEMNLLALVSTPSAGRVHASREMANERTSSPPIALSDILAAPGSEALFVDLLERYSLDTAISGVQAKVVVPGGLAGKAAEKSSLHTPDLIVKTDGGEFPGLAENEYHCMTIARAAGLEVPEFWLSDDRKLFVIRRFDIDDAGRYLGFEEIASLTGRNAERKYQGSYGQVAEATLRNCAPALRAESLGRFFRQFVLCCLLRNGDAHLKNWGILYSDPVGADDDARLSPTYDMVCTTMYLPRDVLALSFEGSKSWPERNAIERFGREKCGVTNSPEVVDELREVVAAYRPAEGTPTWEAMDRELSAAVAQLGRGS